MGICVSSKNNTSTQNIKRKTKNKLSDEQKKNLRNTFDKFDKNSSGILSLDELELILWQFKLETDAEVVQHHFTELDEDKDGKLSFEEFLAWIAAVTSNIHPQDQTLNAFRIYDIDHTGFVSYQQFKEVALRMGLVKSKQDVDDYIKQIDIDNGAHIDYVEFAKSIHKNNH